MPYGVAVDAQRVKDHNVQRNEIDNMGKRVNEQNTKFTALHNKLVDAVNARHK